MSHVPNPNGSGSLDQAAQDRIWEFFQNERPQAFVGSRARLGLLARMVRGSGRVLNIGVGAGGFEAVAIAARIDVYSLDPSQRSIEMLRRRFGLGERAQVGHGQQIPFADGFFGVVVLSEVLEHLDPVDAAAVVADAARVLAIHGLLVGTVPARERLEDQQVFCPHCGEAFHRWGHRQSFDCQKIRDLLAVQFEVERIYQRPLIDWATLNWKGRLHGLVKTLLWRLGIRGEQESIVFVARKNRQTASQPRRAVC
jgi:SAM-dependent methyltransferase